MTQFSHIRYVPYFLRCWLVEFYAPSFLNSRDINIGGPTRRYCRYQSTKDDLKYSIDLTIWIHLSVATEIISTGIFLMFDDCTAETVQQTDFFERTIFCRAIISVIQPLLFTRSRQLGIFEKRLSEREWMGLYSSIDLTTPSRRFLT